MSQVVTLAGEATISRVTSNRAADVISIRLADSAAGIGFVEAEMSLEAFAAALTGRGAVECKLAIRGLDRVGMVREWKEETVAYEGSFFGPGGEVPPEASMALESFEVDGWKGYAHDLSNHHRKGRGGTYRVRFERWVPRVGEAESCA